MNLATTCCCDYDRAQELAEYYMSHFSTTQFATDYIAHGRNNKTSKSANLNFSETVYGMIEEEKYAAQIGTRFSNQTYYYTSPVPTENNVYDCSHIHLLNSSKHTGSIIFCLEIGAPPSVLGRSRSCAFISLSRTKIYPIPTLLISFRFVDVFQQSLRLIKIALESLL